MLQAKTNQGCIILVVGASGSGKDTLIAAAGSAFAGYKEIVFPRRYITRQDTTGENHIAVSEREFSHFKNANAFSLSWHAHGLNYAIPADATDRAASGACVIFNTSRGVVQEARNRFANVGIIQVVARQDVLRERLKGRGRESAADIEARVQRAVMATVPPAEDIINVDNSNDLAAAKRAFIEAIKAYCDCSANRSIS